MENILKIVKNERIMLISIIFTPSRLHWILDLTWSVCLMIMPEIIAKIALTAILKQSLTTILRDNLDNNVENFIDNNA